MTPSHAPLLPVSLLAAILATGPATAPAHALTATHGLVLAQTGPGQFTEQQLKSFAAASLEVERLHQKWSLRVAAAEGPSDEEAIRGQAMEEMSAAVRGEGLTVEEYNRIMSAAQVDPKTAQVVEAYRAEIR